jgi:hypothetical protein
LARAGGGRLLGVPESSIRYQDIDLRFPRPPYGQNGQWVRIVAAADPNDPRDGENIGQAGQAQWFGAESAWFVTTASSGTGIYASEVLDFAPTVTDEEVAAFDAYIASCKAARDGQ